MNQDTLPLGMNAQNGGVRANCAKFIGIGPLCRRENPPHVARNSPLQSRSTLGHLLSKLAWQTATLVVEVRGAHLWPDCEKTPLRSFSICYREAIEQGLCSSSMKQAGDISHIYISMHMVVTTQTLLDLCCLDVKGAVRRSWWNPGGN